jgi:hypothetical protein
VLDVRAERFSVELAWPNSDGFLSCGLFNVLVFVLVLVGFASLALSVKKLMMIAEISGKLSGL